ncbi:hypothetical protein LJB98_04510 [Bacteroidales bacterium OttesenSCG-928-M11]|nr:hypothetical protein [Bacteroidales bacterium OttesenSCG-928-M11]
MNKLEEFIYTGTSYGLKQEYRKPNLELSPSISQPDYRVSPYKPFSDWTEKL